MLEECLKREAEKLCFHETLMNRVVYDCVDPSFYTKVSLKALAMGFD